MEEQIPLKNIGENPSLSVVIPLYNEEKNVELVVAQTIEALTPSHIPFEILCVNNASTDNTEAVIRQMMARHQQVRGVFLSGKGYGLAINTGFKEAKNDLVTFISGDGQIDPQDILMAYEVLQRTGADIVKPRRISRADGIFRKIQSTIYNILLKLFFGLPGWDMNCPAKLIKRSFVEKLNIESTDWFIDPEILIKTKYLGGQMKESEAVYRKRVHGFGQINLGSAWEFFRNMIRWRIHYQELVVQALDKNKRKD